MDGLLSCCPIFHRRAPPPPPPPPPAGDVKGMRIREALEIAIQGGARNLGRDDIGQLAPGFAADFAAWNVGGGWAQGAQL